MSIEVGATGFAELTVSGSDLATVLNQQATDGFPILNPSQPRRPRVFTLSTQHRTRAESECGR